MNAVITFKEVSDFIEKESKIRPRFTTINEKTVEVSYKPGVFMPAISVNVKIEAMRQDIVCMSYECGTAASLMIAGIVAYLEDWKSRSCLTPEGKVLLTPCNHLSLPPLKS